MDQAGTELTEKLRQRGIRRVKIGGFDIDGVLRGKYMSLDKFASVLAAGFGFCDVIFGWDIADTLYGTSSVTGWESGFPDALAVADVGTLRDIPWEPTVAAVLVDFRQQDGGEHPACPRSLLKRVRQRCRDMGYEAYFGCEYEFFLFQETPDSLHEKGFSNLRSLTPGMCGYSWLRSGQNHALVADVLDNMAAFGIDIEGFHTETGPGVYEAALHYDEVLAAADQAALFKVAMKEVAHHHGLSVTFMAKWNAALPGCSGHLHQSLRRRDGDNAFYAAEGLSRTLRHYLGGLCSLMGEVTAMVSPTINAYKRYVPGVWAPLTASWGVDNRTAAARVIGIDSQSACRIEYRQPAADINPYLAMAACLGAGLYGIEHALEPPQPISGDASTRGEPLPATLNDACERFSGSARCRQVFGDAFVDHYAHTRRHEVAEYRRAVSDWELKRYFEAI